jgi:hypothetical protein
VSTGSQGVDLIVRATLEYPGRMGVAKKRLADQEGLAASSLGQGGPERCQPMSRHKACTPFHRS